MEMKIIEQSEDLSHVALVGRLDIMGVQQIEKAFLEATAARRKATIVDLADVTFVSSFGLGMIMKCATVLMANTLKLVLLSPQPTVGELLVTTGMDKLFCVCQGKDEALAILQNP